MLNLSGMLHFKTNAKCSLKYKLSFSIFVPKTHIYSKGLSDQRGPGQHDYVCGYLVDASVQSDINGYIEIKRLHIMQNYAQMNK